MKYLLVSIFFILALGFAKGNNERSDPQRSSNVEDDSDMYMEPIEPQTGETNIEEEETQEKSQNTFYPSFSQPLGHSRPFYYQQEGAYSQRSQPPFQQVFDAPVRFAGYKEEYPAASTTSSETLGLLGSGNFGVIRGGTYYNDNDGEQSEQSSYSDFNSYFHNGHGRPSFYGGGSGGPPNPKPYKHEQFANFKDFADINTPPDRQYSQYVVVYANKNGTSQRDGEEQAPKKIVHRPKNIIESLAMLDLESPTAPDIVPEKKLSKSKRKLALLLPEKKYKDKLKRKEIATKDFSEPLLALS